MLPLDYLKYHPQRHELLPQPPHLLEGQTTMCCRHISVNMSDCPQRHKCNPKKYWSTRCMEMSADEGVHEVWGCGNTYTRLSYFAFDGSRGPASSLLSFAFRVQGKWRIHQHLLLPCFAFNARGGSTATSLHEREQQAPASTATVDGLHYCHWRPTIKTMLVINRLPNLSTPLFNSIPYTVEGIS